MPPHRGGTAIRACRLRRPETVDGVGIPGHARRPKGARGSTTHHHDGKLPGDYSWLRGCGLCPAHRRPCTVWSAIEGRSVTSVTPALAEMLEERPRQGQTSERAFPFPDRPVRERVRGPYHVDSRLIESRRARSRSAPPDSKIRSTWTAHARSHGDLAVVSQGSGTRLQVLPVRSRLTFNTVSGTRTRIARTDRVEKLLRARSGPAAKAAVAPHRFDNASTLP